MNLIGRKIVGVVRLSDDLREKEGWENSPHFGVSIVLDDGSFIYASQDEEGNGPGAFFGFKDEQSYYILPPLPEDMEGR